MLGAAGVQIPENNLDDLHSSREEDGTSETMDPQDLLGLGVLVSRAVGFLRGTSAVVVILVRGYTFPTIVKVRPVGYDPLALVDGFTPVEDNIGLLETRFDEEAVFMFVFPEDVTGSVNLTLLSLFFWVTATNLSLELLMLGQNRNLFLSVPKVVRVSCPIVQQSKGYLFHINLKHFWSNGVS
ncbi:hypothetical protein Tco_0858816 [Tanacetum coccineum]|uniref:Uncharacterized protein n=1 Tax=Tanacetum coccineum TaxID=301880 RepID=A0ABQ5BE86_9ASTR